MIMNAYKPGQSVRSSMTAKSLGILVDAAVLTVTILYPDGTTATPTATVDGTGLYHADFVIPVTMVPGIAVQRWQSTGMAPTQNATRERLFRIDSLDNPS